MASNRDKLLAANRKNQEQRLSNNTESNNLIDDFVKADEIVVVEEKPEPVIVEVPKPIEPNNTVLNIINRKQKVPKHNHSFYLEDTVYNNLLKFCKDNNMSVGEFVNELIKANT